MSLSLRCTFLSPAHVRRHVNRKQRIHRLYPIQVILGDLIIVAQNDHVHPAIQFTAFLRAVIRDGIILAVTAADQLFRLQTDVILQIDCHIVAQKKAAGH